MVQACKLKAEACGVFPKKGENPREAEERGRLSGSIQKRSTDDNGSCDWNV